MDEMKQAKKTYSHLGWCYIAGTVAVHVLQILYVLYTKYYPADWQSNLNFVLLISSFCVYVCGLPLIFLLAKNMPVTKPEKHKMKWWQFLIAACMSYSMVYISNLIGVMITATIGALKGSAVQNNLIAYVTQGNIFINFFLMVVVAPIMEELVFRKVLVDRALRYGEGMAIVLSGLMFGLFHGNLNQFAYAVVLGGFFAYLYIRTGNIKITMGLHAMINFMGSVVASQLMKAIHYEELLQVNPEDPSAAMNLVMNNLGGLALVALYGFCIFIVVIAGVILIIVSAVGKKFILKTAEVQIPKDKRFKTLLVNPGMLVFCGVWIVMIILQLFE